MEGKVPANSILKQRSSTPKPTLSDAQKAKAERDRRNLGIAFHHANKIQSQKDVEASILSNIETLLELPSSRPFTSAEASTFVSLIAPFQPSDFDSLVEERKADGKCGYSLCSNSPRSVTLGTSASWKLKSQGAGDYCSDDCFRKALYVKTQLSEVPAWERAPGQHLQIVLHGDDNYLIDSARLGVSSSLQNHNLSNRQLARERGEELASLRPNQVMADKIVEKFNLSHNLSTPIDNSETSSAAIEGYVPMQTVKQTSERSSTVTSGNRIQEKVSVGLNEDSKNDEDESWNALYENLPRS